MSCIRSALPSDSNLQKEMIPAYMKLLPLYYENLSGFMRSRQAIFSCDETQIFSIMGNTEFFYTPFELLHLSIIYSIAVIVTCCSN